MEAVLLKSKIDSKSPKDTFVVFDEMFQGVMTRQWFLPVFTGAKDGLRVITMEYLIDNYKFPEKNGRIQMHCVDFLRGANPDLVKKIETYKDESLEIEPV